MINYRLKHCYFIIYEYIESAFNLFSLQSFGSNKQFPDILLSSLLINNVYFLHHSRIKYPKATTDVLFADFSVRTNNIIIP